MTASKKLPYIARGDQRLIVKDTQSFNIDNGSGTTLDEAAIYSVGGLYIVDAYVVYDEATDTTGAAGANVKIGTTAGGAGVVGSTNLGVSKAVGSAVKLSLVAGGDYIPAGSTVFVRHTGIAATEAGKYHVQIRYLAVP